jgi:hypothetical protein
MGARSLAVVAMGDKSPNQRTPNQRRALSNHTRRLVSGVPWGRIAPLLREGQCPWQRQCGEKVAREAVATGVPRPQIWRHCHVPTEWMRRLGGGRRKRRLTACNVWQA